MLSKQSIYNINLPLTKKHKNLIFLPLILLLPFICFLNFTKHKYASHYEKKLLPKIIFLTRDKNGVPILRLYIAQKLCCIFCGLVITLIYIISVDTDYASLIVLLTMTFLIAYLPDRRMDRQIDTSKRNLQTGFYDYLNVLIMLLGAGLNLTTAIRRAIDACQSKNAFREEIHLLTHEITNGKHYVTAFEDLAGKCGIFEITSFAAAIIQNYKKGNHALLSSLRLLRITCRENQRNLIKKLAEEASTKLLFPTMLIFAAILLITIFPAISQLRI